MLLKRSCHYWAIVEHILSPSSDSSQSELLSEARMTIANEALYRQDMSRALRLYSRVKTAPSAWNQSEVCAPAVTVARCSILYPEALVNCYTLPRYIIIILYMLLTRGAWAATGYSSRLVCLFVCLSVCKFRICSPGCHSTAFTAWIAFTQ